MRDDRIRSQGISGSEIAAVVGLSPWRGPLSVYLGKIGETRDEASGHNVERGTHLGPALVRWYEQRTGLTVTHAGEHEQTVVHPVHELVRATPDGRVHSGSRQSAVVAALEVKSPSWRSAHAWGDPGTDQVPEYYVPQCTFEAAVLGAPRTDLAALIDGDLRIYQLPYDEDLFQALLDAASKFWRDHVLARVPPPMDGSDECKEWLAKQHPKATRDLIEASAQTEALVNEYRAIAEQEKVLDERKASVRNNLVQIIGDHAGIKGLATLSGGERKATDWKALATELGATDDTIERHTATKPCARTLRIKGV